MRNAYVIDRARYDMIVASKWIRNSAFGGLDLKVVQMLDIYVVEENDGGATFLKNRYPLNDVDGPRYTAEQYARWQEEQTPEGKHRATMKWLNDVFPRVTSACERDEELIARIVEMTMDIKPTAPTEELGKLVGDIHEALYLDSVRQNLVDQTEKARDVAASRGYKVDPRCEGLG